MIDKFLHGFINSVYDFNEFTLNELLCKLAQKMDEVITQSNESFNYLDWLKGQGLSDEVIKIMLEWKENGTLETLINDVLLQNIQNDVNNIRTETNAFKTETNETINTFKTEINSQLDVKASKITVEEFGVIGDGITDDTVNLQKAIDYAADNKLTLTSKSNKIFLTSATLNITKNFYLDFSNAILKSSAEIALKINTNSGSDSDTQSYIKGLTLDCESNLKGISINAKRCYLDNLYFKNITNVGLSLDGGYEITVSNSNFKGITPTNKAIVVNTTDNYVTHCFGTDNNVFIENNASGNIFESCHSWIYTPSILPDSIFINFKVSGIANNCVSDTYYIGFRCNATGTCRITNNNFIINLSYYNYNKAPIFINFYDGTSVYKTTICNNWVSFPSKSETGFEVDGYFYNIDKKYVYGQVFGNNGYNIGNPNLSKAIVPNGENNITSKQSYVIRKNNRVSLKGYFAYDNPIPSTETIVFTLPEGFRPFQNFYASAVIGENIEKLSTVCNAFIKSTGEVIIKNISDNTNAAQGIINVEFDVWESDINS